MKRKYIHPETCLIEAGTQMLAGSGTTEPGVIHSSAGSHTDSNGNKSIVMSKPFNAWEDDLSNSESRDSLW